ncbi:MAG: pyridoxal-phosphate dependent enzyme [Rhizobiaceae bacterium]
MRLISNPFRGPGLQALELQDVPSPSVSGDKPMSLLERCPRAGATPLIEATSLASACGVGRVSLKDERDRMGLGSFKALGAAYVIACDAEAGTAAGTTYVTASAGNHGMSVAAGAAAFGARAVIYLSETVPQSFADKLLEIGADVVRAGDDYEGSMRAAQDAAARDGAILLSDSSWPGYTEHPLVLMQGYLVLMHEVFDQIDAPPSHIFLQAGVGGLAGAAAAAARAQWGDAPVIVVVEPEVAPALAGSIEAGRPVKTEGPVSAMGRLDCKEPSLIALKGLARDADFFVTISEEEGFAGAKLAEQHGYETTPSGAAGLAALALAGQPSEDIGLRSDSRALIFLSERADG